MAEYESDGRLLVGGLTPTAWQLLRRMPRSARESIAESALIVDMRKETALDGIAELHIHGYIARLGTHSWQLTVAGWEKLRSASATRSGVRER